MELATKYFALNGRLKPEARLGLAISEFAQSLDSERRKKFQSLQAEESTQISGRDVIKVTEEINREGARQHRSWRPHGTKVGGFLSRIQTFASIGDVLIGGSQNLIATGVWSAVRLSLTVATNYLSYFEKLSTLFMKLGTSWALHEDFAQLFPRSEILQTHFYEYLIVLMRLCNNIVVFGQKKVSAQLISSLGTSFDSEFGAIQKELDQWGYLIQQQCQLQAMKTINSAEKSRLYDLKQRVLRRLSPFQSDFETRWRRQRKRGTCKWIFDTQIFKDWESTRTSATLCVSGKLGSGKTVSMANIVARTDLEQPCAYAFCASQEPNSMKAANILGTIAFNLLDHVPEKAVAWGEAETSKAMTNNFDPESIIDFVLDILPNDRMYIVLVDGLEECSDADMTDVISGLCRLTQNRDVLLCYSSRSDSHLYHVATQYFQPKLSISHDDFSHDAELETYIVEEVTRRNATRHLSPELEELVKNQLIVGAQGMYLWASLQLDTIFPASSNVVITDDRILNLITHLPRNLPEAFEQALEGILDHQYEGRIMKLVLSAVDPLDLDEIRIALSIVLGELIWHPENVANNGTQLISLCGGNLLDLDEEDGKVRFIHHSVIRHLLSPAARRSTTQYHFTAEDAENFIGATCVTYLHLPVLDSRITATRNLQSLEVLDNVTQSTRQSVPIISRLVQHIRAREHKRGRPAQIDIGHILSQLQAAQIEEYLDPRTFEHYAAKNWLYHTRFFDVKIQNCKETWRLWWRLVNGGVATFKPPFAELKSGLRMGQIDEVVRALELRRSIHGQWLGDILAQYLEDLGSITMSSTANIIIFLLDAGADPTALHSISKSSPVELLTRRICTDALSSEDEQRLVRDFFSHPAVKESLETRSLLWVLEMLLPRVKTVAMAQIVSLRPGLVSEFHQTHTISKERIENSLDNENWDEVEVLSILGFVNTPTIRETTLLWKAIETMSDAWVEHLLRLGADPNAGPFRMTHHKMTHYMHSPYFLTKCYPLEAALWLRRTKVCLQLLRHGANLELCESAIKIAQKTENSILVARLHEVSDWSGRQEQTGGQQRYEHGCTALTTACKMLSHISSKAKRLPEGFPRPKHNGNAPLPYWRSRLCEIILELACDQDDEYVNARDDEGETALHYVSKTKDIESSSFQSIVDVLLTRGADPTLEDRNGETPLCIAIRNPTPVDDFTPVDSLLEPLLTKVAYADLNRVCPQHNVSMLKAAMDRAEVSPNQDVAKLVRLLLQAGADPRDPLDPKSPDPGLMAAAAEIDGENLGEQLKEYTDTWNAADVVE